VCWETLVLEGFLEQFNCCVGWTVAGLPLFHGFLTQASRSQRASLFIVILASLPIQ
jgi:hypothetical protein